MSAENTGPQEFELRVHKCFGRIFELLQQIDGIAQDKAEQEEANGDSGEFCNIRDWVEEAILQCHLAWQYHRLCRGPSKFDTWEKVENSSDGGEDEK